ncbi:MAG: hypothetical protein ACK5JH_08730 [Anaerocolumna sp.]
MIKIKVLAILICATVLLTAYTKNIDFEFSFEKADVSSIEMFHFDVPANAEKKILTEQSDIDAIYDLFENLTLKDKETEDTVGGGVTSFRFNLLDGTNYELIYVPQGVKKGRLSSSTEEFDYFTSADIEGYWSDFDIESNPVSEDELPKMSK